MAHPIPIEKNGYIAAVMNNELIFLIPADKLEAVKKALYTVFGADEVERIEPLTKGLSTALVFKIIVKDNPYLLRVIIRMDDMADPGRYFGNMTIAANASLAPVIHYLNAEDRISITDMVMEFPFSITDALKKLPGTLRNLHQLPAFPFRVNYFTSMGGIVNKVRSAELAPTDMTKAMYEWYDRLLTVYPMENTGDWVACHNDLKPENIIYDGERPWLIDWEAAFFNDPYMDMNVVANFVVRTDEDETTFLSLYFGGAVNDYKRARFFVMGMLLHVYYYSIFLLIGSGGIPVSVNDVEKDDFRAFHDRMWKGEIDLADNKMKTRYAFAHLKTFNAKAVMARFNKYIFMLTRYANDL